MKAKWIYYPGDFELFLFQKVMTNRYERDVLVPPFWRMDSFYQNLKFTKRFIITKEQKILIKVSKGTELNILLDSTEYIYDFDEYLIITPGTHEITITLYNRLTLPCLYVKSDELVSDESWFVTCNDNTFVKASSEEFYKINNDPSLYKLPVKKIGAVKEIENEDKKIIDLGRESMVYVKVKNLSRPTRVYFGETLYEAKDFENCETLYQFTKKNEITRMAKACRYIAMDKEICGDFSFYEEYYKHEFQPAFECDDKLVNEIYKTSLRTFDLNCREFFLDGIKRDRWVWGGDAYQSMLMSFYTFNDNILCKRTMLALLGKKPFNCHINHILDYTLYWIIGFYDYVFHTGDITFAKNHYHDLTDLLNFVLSRRNKNNLLEGLEGDWVFVDWTNLNNQGEVSVEQMLLYKALVNTSKLADLLDKKVDCQEFLNIACELKEKINKYYDYENEYYRYTCINSKYTDEIRKHPSIFAILFDLCDEECKQKLLKNVLCNNEVLKITTPYMMFYELEAKMKMGLINEVIDEIKEYWGGMLKLGATSFWEAYDKNEEEPSCYSMYSRKYGKSLCHAWGASPLYLIGKYFLRIKPTTIGYETYECSPVFSQFNQFNAHIPVGKGSLRLEFSNGILNIFSTHGLCTLNIDDFSFCIKKNTKYVVDIRNKVIKYEKK